MNASQRPNSQKERIQWFCVAIICGAIVWFYSPKSSIANECVGFNPITLLKLEQENPIKHLFTKFVFREIPDRMKELL